MEEHQLLPKDSRGRTKRVRPLRTVVHLATEFQSITMLKTIEGRGYTFDLSNNGCCIETDAKVEVGTYLAMQLELSPDEAASWIYIPVARVRWVCDGRFGVEFLKPPGQDAERLRNFVWNMASQCMVKKDSCSSS